MGKVEQSRWKDLHLPLHLGVVAIEKEPSGHSRLWSPTLLTYLMKHAQIYIDGFFIYMRPMWLLITSNNNVVSFFSDLKIVYNNNY